MCVCVCVRACVRACMRVCVCVCKQAHRLVCYNFSLVVSRARINSVFANSIPIKAIPIPTPVANP